MIQPPKDCNLAQAAAEGRIWQHDIKQHQNFLTTKGVAENFLALTWLEEQCHKIYTEPHRKIILMEQAHALVRTCNST